MKISVQWLNRHVDLTGISPEEIAEDLTIHTAEVEGVERFAPHLADVVVGHVIERVPHPDADRLSLCRVDVGEDEPLQIVCGAPNVRQGLKVAVGKVGTVLPGGLKLKKAKIRGVESRGMICSERELELGDDHSGIWELPEDATVGRPVDEALGLVDWVIEIDNKSLTHRPDLWGHRGIASEIAAIRGLELNPLDLTLPETGGGAPPSVRVETDGCSRYVALPIDGVRVERSPMWLRMLLLAVGQRPLDLLVDLSNFVMLDIAQPNHLFDRAKLGAEGIVVRRARDGETMRTLDGEERTFTPDDMLICSGDRPVAVAGVMGGEDSKVAPETTELLLEVASFHPTVVRRTAARLGLRTDASTRFEKSLDPTLPMKAAAHLVRTLRSIQPDVALPAPPGEDGQWSDPARTVSLRPDRVRRILGANVEDDRMEAILTSLGFRVDRGGETWTVHVPSARATKDVGIEEDLIEEIGRMVGYGNIEECALVTELVPAPRDERRSLVRTLTDRLSGPARFHEAQTHTFQSAELLESLGALDAPYVEVLNPQIEGLSRVRRHVLPSLLAVLEKNLRNREEVRLFEIGKGYHPEHGNERGEPREVHEVALLWAAPRTDANAPFDQATTARLQGVVEDAIRSCERAVGVWRAASEAECPSYAHPGRAMVLDGPEGGAPLAFLAPIEPGAARALGATGELDCEVAIARVSLDGLLAEPRVSRRYEPLPRFPGVKVDVALAVPDAMPAAEAVALIEKAAKGLAARVELFDLYRGENVAAGQKSLAYHVLLQSPSKTLTDGDVAKFLGRVERAAEAAGGTLRRQ
ncbi:MAG TPA: phenylalanine--tRNA ligase subunit beta [Planctomycetes bacterium]|nr:phenylalanine--tRNA ligase subunit beta [Planctomycetota bacterium]